MSKMSELFIEIQEMLMDEMPVDQIVKKTGAPLDWVLQVKKTLIQDSMDYVHGKTFRCTD